MTDDWYWDMSRTCEARFALPGRVGHPKPGAIAQTARRFLRFATSESVAIKPKALARAHELIFVRLDRHRVNAQFVATNSKRGTLAEWCWFAAHWSDS
jgi:hypothetical protein